jgi:hypothetical protein
MSKNRTSYTVRIDGVDTDFSRSKKETAVSEATRALKAREGYVVEVVTGTGTVVFTAARRKITKFTKPGTKLVTLSDTVAALVPEGYAAAYERPRNGTVVLRREADIEEDDSRYAVLDVIAKGIVGYAETTRGAGQIMKTLGRAVARTPQTV